MYFVFFQTPGGLGSPDNNFYIFLEVYVLFECLAYKIANASCLL